MSLVLSAMDVFVELETKITSGIYKNVPIIENAAICTESL